MLLAEPGCRPWSLCEKIGFPPSYNGEAIKRLIDVRLMYGGMEDRSMTG